MEGPPTPHPTPPPLFILVIRKAARTPIVRTVVTVVIPHPCDNRSTRGRSILSFSVRRVSPSWQARRAQQLSPWPPGCLSKAVHIRAYEKWEARVRYNQPKAHPRDLLPLPRNDLFRVSLTGHYMLWTGTSRNMYSFTTGYSVPSCVSFISEQSASQLFITRTKMPDPQNL